MKYYIYSGQNYTKLLLHPLYGFHIFIIQVLKHTGQFDHCPDEPIIWLDAMTSSSSMTFDPEAAANFLQRTLTKVVRNPYPFNDRIMEVVAEAETSSGDDSIMEEGEDAGSVSDAGISGDIWESYFYHKRMLNTLHILWWFNFHNFWEYVAQVSDKETNLGD